MKNTPLIALLIAFLAVPLFAAPPTPEQLEKVKAALPASAPVKPAKARKILIFSRTAGFRHSSIEVGAATLKLMGEKTGAYTADHTEDPAAFSTENLKQYDAICLLSTTGSFLATDDQKKALMAFVKGGKGIIGIHSATDCFYDWDEYGEMIGGWFWGHPWHEKVGVKLDDPAHPLAKPFDGKPFEIVDEIYQFQPWPYSRKRSHVLLSLDTSKTDMTKNGVKRGKEGDYGVSWVHNFGQGRVYYCSLGHREEIYWNPTILAYYLHGIQFAIGDLPADATPSEKGSPDPKPHAGLIEKLRAGDAATLQALDETIGQAKADAQASLLLEWGLLQALNNTTTPVEVRQLIARKIWLIGADAAVIGLAPLLEDATLAQSARFSLERIDHPYASYFLVGALGKLSGDLKIGVVNSIAAKRLEQAVKPLAGMIGEKDSKTREAAIAALGKIGNDEAAAALAAARPKAEGETRAALTDAYLAVADQFAEKGEKAKAAAIYQTLFAESEPEQIRVAALRGLVASQENPIPTLTALVGGKDEAMKVVAVRMLQEIPGEASGKAMSEALTSAGPAVQSALIEALAARRDTSAGPAVMKIIETSKDEKLRLTALKSLAKIGDASAVMPLATLAAEGKGEARSAARLSLASLRGKDVNGKILASLEGAKPVVASELLRALGERQAEELVPQLIAAAPKNADANLRRDTYKVLGDLAPAAQLPAMVALLTGETDDGAASFIERAVIAVAGRAADPAQRVAPILAAHEKSQGPARASLLRVLGGVGGEKSLAAVRGDLNASDPAVKEAAARALASWPDESAAADLLKLAKESDQPNAKILALRGYIRLAGVNTARPAPQTVAMYRQALELAQRPDEKRLVLAALAALPSEESLKLTESLLADADLKAEAEQAAKKIRESLK